MAGPLIQALCWTLIHSLWQSLIAAVIAGIIVVGTKKSSSRLRYTLLTMLFFGFMAVSAGTFIRLLGQNNLRVSEARATDQISGEDANGGLSASGSTAGYINIRQGYIAPGARPMSGTGRQALLPSGQGNASAALEESETPFRLRLEEYCNNHALTIVTLWMIFLIIKLARTGASLNYIRRIRRYQTSAPSDYWADRIRELAASLGMRRPIQLLESGLITVPMVIGFLKPVILIPLGILAELPPDQLEAVLLHELAHIRRKDYLVNLLQNFAEALFFFNPALLWISSLIREERENCCDDVAIGATRSKSQLIHALVAFQEYGERTPAFAVAFPGRRTHLLDRVKRIVYNRNKTLNAMEKVLLAACFLITGSLTVAFSAASRNQQPATQPVRAIAYTQDTIPVAPATIYDYSGTQDTFPVQPVAPVAPVSPVAPVPPVSGTLVPVVPLSGSLIPVAPLSGSLIPVAPAPGSLIPVATMSGSLIPVAPASGIIAPIAPKSRLVAPKAPIPPIPGDTLPGSAFQAPSGPGLLADGLQGGTFHGSLKINDNTIEYARGIWTKGNVTKYFMGANQIAKTDGVTTELYIDNKRIPNDQLGNYTSQVDGMIAQLEEEYKRQARAYANRSTGTYGRGTRDEGVISGKGVTSRTQSITMGKGDSAVTITSSSSDIVVDGAGNVGVGNSSYGGSTVGVGNSTSGDSNVGVGSSSISSGSGPGSLNASSSHSEVYSVDYVGLTKSNTTNDSNRPIIEAIFGEHLASDSKEFSFSLNYHHFIINGVHQPDEVFNRFRDKYVKGKKDSYTYIRKEGSTTSTVSEENTSN